MRRLADGLVAASRRWQIIALATALTAAVFWGLFRLEDGFTALTGQPVLDTQNDLTAESLRRQLPLYAGPALAAYWRFAAFDFIFPLVAALFQCLAWTLLMRASGLRFAPALLGRRLQLLPLLATLFDWLENISILGTLAAGSAPPAWLAQAVIICKRLKLGALTATGGLTFVLVALALAHGLPLAWRRWRGK